MKPETGFKSPRQPEPPRESQRPTSLLGRAFAAIYENDILFVIAIILAILIFIRL
jgi:hypothetical protein